MTIGKLPSSWPKLATIGAFLFFVSMSQSRALGITPEGQSSTSNEVAKLVLTECEGVDNCATWTFVGGEGRGEWPTGESANLSVREIRQIDADNWTIKIHRIDVSTGYTSEYNGKLRKNGRIGGEFKSSKGDEGDWYALPAAPVPLPRLLHMCEAICETFKLENGRLIGVVTSGRLPEPGWSDTIVIEKFTPESVIFKRTLTGSPVHFSVVYKGQISADKSSIVNAKNPFCCNNGQPEFTSFVWGEMLNTLPGQGPAGNPRQTNEFTTDQLLKGADIAERLLRDWLTYEANHPHNN